MKQISDASIAHAEQNMKLAPSCLKSTLQVSGDVRDNDNETYEACTDVEC